MKAHKTELKAYTHFPRSWRDPETKTGYDLHAWMKDLSIAEREAMGWYDIVDNMPVIAVNEKADKLPLVFTGSTIEQNYTVAEVMPMADYIDQKAQEQIDKENAKELAKLEELDLKAIQYMRKMLAKQPDAPAELIKNEADAVIALSKLQ